MTEKVGRNDPCPCGSGKKYKQCCFLTSGAGKKKKMTATWVNQPRAPAPPNLLDRTFGEAIAQAGEKPPTLPKSFKAEKGNAG